jgi:hypothetical protein
LATGDRAGGLYVWEAHTAREYFTLRGHTSAITDISWREDSNVVASCSEDTTIRTFEMENGNQVRAWGAHGNGAQAVTFSKDGRIVSAGRDRLARVWDGNGGSQRIFEAFPDVALKAVFTHDTGRVIAGDWTGQVYVWNTADGKRVGTLSTNPPSVAEQHAIALKTAAEKQKAYESLTAVAKASEATFVKANADLAATQKAINDTAATIKPAEQKLNQAKATVATAQAALKTAQNSAKAKNTLSQALAEAAGKVKLEADKDKSNTQLQDALNRALSLSGQAAAEMTLAEKNVVDMTAAAKAVEPALVQAQQSFNTIQAQSQAATKNLPALQNAVKAAQAKAASDKAAEQQALVEWNNAKAALAKWQSVVAMVKPGGK